MKAIENVSRRGFLKAVGIASGSFVLGIKLPLAHAKTSLKSTFHQLNFFVSIANDSTVTLVCHRSELGQGNRTSVPQIIAEELEANWQQVNVVQAKADTKYGSQGTGGSASIRNHFTNIRQIGAVARHMLEQAAANIWQVELSAVKAQQHFVVHTATGEKISFGELASHAAKLTPPENDKVKLKNNADFSLIGKDVELVDLDDIVAGKATYAQDIQLPNMLIATIVRPPVVGGKVASFDATETLKIKGVVDVIQLKDRPLPVTTNPVSGVAVLANNTWAALEGRKRLKIKWLHGDKQNHNSNDFSKKLAQQVQTKGEKVALKGDVYNHQYHEENTVEATYTCLLYSSPSPRDATLYRMASSA